MKALQIAAAAGLVGAIALGVLYPRLDPAARFATTIDRAEAIHRAEQLSARYGTRTDGWKVDAAIRVDEKLRRYRVVFPDDPAGKLLTPLIWGVAFTQPGSGHTVRVELTADGRPGQWELRRGRGKGAAPTPIAVNRETLLHDFAGGHDSDFYVRSGPSLPGFELLEWEWAANGKFPLQTRIRAAQKDGLLWSVGIEPAYAREFYVAPSLWPSLVVGFTSGIAIVFALVYCFRGWGRGVLRWKPAALFLLVVAAWSFAMAWGGPQWQGVRYETVRQAPAPPGVSQRQEAASDFESGFEAGSRNNQSSAQARRVALWVAESFGGLLMFFVFAAAGYAIAHGRWRTKWTSIEAAVSGQVATRQVCGPAAAGALWGIALAAFPYLVGAVFPGRMIFIWHDGVAARAPESGLLSFWAAVPAFGFLGFALPWAFRLRNKWAGRIVVGVAFVMFALPSTARFDAMAVSAIVSTGVAAACYLLYRAFDLLAVACALATARAVLVPCLLLTQHASSLRDAGIRSLFLLSAALAAAVYFGARGRMAEVRRAESDADLLSEGRSRSSRERLEAEFQIARQAQQDALPAVPAGVGGFSFAAACEPAKQVGGDLYDFFSLPDGRLGIAVADVSGKGVPAALYMMVTKGLLDATSRDSSDLRHILESVNRHLHQACKRKVFVTLAAIVVDPGKKTVEYGRAGHNPIVWRRARRNETLLVKPGGLGLGMCSAEPFGRSLRIEEIELEEGDALVLYSDGITEAINGTMEQFGEERLIESVARTDGRGAVETRAAILRDLAEFTAGTPARDDVTVVTVRVEG